MLCMSLFGPIWKSIGTCGCHHCWARIAGHRQSDTHELIANWAWAHDHEQAIKGIVASSTLQLSLSGGISNLIRPYKITYLILILSIIGEGGGILLLISVDIRQCRRFIYNAPVPQFQNLGATSYLDDNEYRLSVNRCHPWIVATQSEALEWNKCCPWIVATQSEALEWKKRHPWIVATASKCDTHPCMRMISDDTSARSVYVVRVVPTADSSTEKLCILLTASSNRHHMYLIQLSWTSSGFPKK